MKIRPILFLFFCSIFLLLNGCNTPIAPMPTPTPIIIPTRVLEQTDPTALPEQQTTWQIVQAGLETRTLLIHQNELLLEQITVLRIDPTFFRWDVGYKPRAPLSLEQWQAETGAFIVVNGGFFTEENVATGLTISQGETSGVSYDFGGMLGISNGFPQLMWLEEQAYNAAKSWDAGLQSFPMLLFSQGQGRYDNEDGDRNRRTVIAEDRFGRFLLIITQRGHFTLAEMATFLAESDFELISALNLDGGSSTGILSQPLNLNIPAFSTLPTVILIYPR